MILSCAFDDCSLLVAARRFHLELASACRGHRTRLQFIIGHRSREVFANAKTSMASALEWDAVLPMARTWALASDAVLSSPMRLQLR